MQQQFLPPEPSITPPFLVAQDTQADNDTLNEQGRVMLQRDTHAVTDLLAATHRKIRRRKRRFWGSFAICEGSLLFGLFPCILVWHNTSLALPLIGGFLAASLTALVVMLYTLLRPSEFDAEELQRIGGVRAIPPLFDAMTSGSIPGGRKEIYRALAQLLPQLKATDANLLTAGHRRLLNRLLSVEAWPGWWGPKTTDLSLSLAILKAYEQVGDAKAIPIVEKLTKVQGKGERAQKMRQAAQQCLPLLQSHTVPLDQNQTLLRAAGQSNDAPDVLLRPAAETAHVPAGELLRATTEETAPQ